MGLEFEQAVPLAIALHMPLELLMSKPLLVPSSSTIRPRNTQTRFQKAPRRTWDWTFAVVCKVVCKRVCNVVTHTEERESLTSTRGATPKPGKTLPGAATYSLRLPDTKLIGGTGGGQLTRPPQQPRHSVAMTTVAAVPHSKAAYNDACKVVYSVAEADNLNYHPGEHA